MEEILKKIDELLARIPEENDTEKARYYYATGCKETIESIKKVILAEQKNNGWIPVSKRLPEDEKCIRLRVTIRCKSTNHTFTDRMRWFFGRFSWLNGKLLANEFEVIAWMEDKLPEPYKAD